jgi:hypothetical protein
METFPNMDYVSYVSYFLIYFVLSTITTRNQSPPLCHLVSIWFRCPFTLSPSHSPRSSSILLNFVVLPSHVASSLDLFVFHLFQHLLTSLDHIPHLVEPYSSLSNFRSFHRISNHLVEPWSNWLWTIPYLWVSVTTYSTTSHPSSGPCYTYHSPLVVFW